MAPTIATVSEMTLVTATAKGLARKWSVSPSVRLLGRWLAMQMAMRMVQQSVSLLVRMCRQRPPCQ